MSQFKSVLFLANSLANALPPTVPILQSIILQQHSAAAHSNHAVLTT